MVHMPKNTNCSFIILISVICNLRFATTEYQESFYSLEKENAVLSHSGLQWNANASSKLSCARFCTEDSTCCTGSYDSSTHACILLSDCNPVLQSSNTGFLIRKHHDNIAQDLCLDTGSTPLDCSELPTGSPSGIYTIHPTNTAPVCVFCDEDGWTVFQRRVDGTTDFLRNWTSYKNGFGDVNNEYWIGNDFLHQLTFHKSYTLRIEVTSFGNEFRFAEYTQFLVADESNFYKLTVGDYSGNLGALMDHSNGMSFSTIDQDHDTWGAGACTNLRGGCFWYGYCTYANLNGKYYSDPTTAGQDSIYTWPWKSGTGDPMKNVTMKIK